MKEKCSLPLRERLKCSLSQIFMSNKFFSHTLLSKVNHAQNAIGRNILLNFLKEKCIISAGLDLKVWLEFPSLNVELIFSFKEIIFIEIPFKHVLFKPRNAIPKFSVKINADIGFRNLVCLQEYMYTLKILYLVS